MPRTRSRLLAALCVLTLAGGAALVACSSSSSGGSSSQCNSNPWQCPAGQTCWLADQNANFACLNSAVGKNKGDTCVNTIGAPTCGDAMVCFQAVGTSSGTCVPYCDPTNAAHACAAGETCQPAAYPLPGGGHSGVFYVCSGGEPPDGGTDTGAPTDTGSPPPDTGTSEDTGPVPPDAG
jgi:hypothetical protein